MNVDWTGVIFGVLVITLILGGGLLVVLKGMTMHQAKEVAEINSKEGMLLRSLAEEATAAQRTTASELTELRLAQVDIRDRLAKIEILMTEVG